MPIANRYEFLLSTMRLYPPATACLLLLLFFGAASQPALAQERHARALRERTPEMTIQYHRAETAWKSGGSMLEAKARVDRVLKELPDDVEARKLRAEVLIGMGRPAEGLADAQRAVLLSPSDGEAQLILSEAARLCGKAELAEDALDRAAKHEEQTAAFQVRLSWNALELGLLDKAERFGRAALALGPEEPVVYYQLARVLVRRDRSNDAAAVIARGLRAYVVSPEAVVGDPLLAPLLRHDTVQDALRP